MAFTFGFYNSNNGDRRYTADQVSSLFDGLITDGVFATISDGFMVIPGEEMNVVVKTGKAWFNHTWNINDSTMALSIPASDFLLPRYDAVILEVNSNAESRTNSIKVISGTPSQNPAKPILINDGGVYQHPLAYIYVEAGATSIINTNIEVVVGSSECPFVTGLVEGINIDDLFQQWEGEFEAWFENVKAQLSDNVAANLQRQIDEKVAKVDKATMDDVKGSTENKWVDSKLLKNVKDEIFLTGDLKQSYNNNQDPNEWMMLDGRKIDANNYPTIKDYLFRNIDYNNCIDLWDGSAAGSNNFHINIADVCYHDGIWAVCGQYCTNSTKYHWRIAWSTDLTNWSYQNIYSVSNQATAKPIGIEYIDGYWVVVGTTLDSGKSMTATLMYTDDILSGTTWTRIDISDGTIYRKVKGFHYINNIMIIVVEGYYSSSESTMSIMTYTANDLFGEWTLLKRCTSNDADYGGIECHNDQWVMTFRVQTSTDTYALLILFYNTYENFILNTNRKTTQLWNINSLSPRTIPGAIKYINNYWVVCAGIRDVNATIVGENTSVAVFAYCKDSILTESSEWIVGQPLASGSNDSFTSGLIEYNGYFCFLVYSGGKHPSTGQYYYHIAYSKDLKNFSFIWLGSTTAYYSSTENNMLLCLNDKIVTRRLYHVSNVLRSALLLSDDIALVPDIENTYMKL